MVDGCCGNGHVSLTFSSGGVAPADTSDIPGIVRFPINLMEGVRSACAATWRRTLVVNIVLVGPVGLGCGRGLEEVVHGAVDLRGFENFDLLTTTTVLRVVLGAAGQV